MIEYTNTRYHNNFAYYKNDEIIGRSLRNYGEYAQPEVDFLLSIADKLIESNNGPIVVYDVGSNIGYHATAFASKHAEVYCFEPNPLNYKLLEQNTAKFKNVHLTQCAVSNQNGTTNIGIFDLDSVSNFGDVHINDQNGVPVTTIRLDDVNLPNPHIIKIDVEGYEYGVMLGAEQIIKSYMPMIYYEAQDLRDFDKIWFFLTRLNYRLYWAVVRNYNINNLKQNTNNIFSNSAIFDVIALPQSMGELKGALKVLGPDDNWQRLCQSI